MAGSLQCEMAEDVQTFVPLTFRAGTSYEGVGGSLLRLVGQAAQRMGET